MRLSDNHTPGGNTGATPFFRFAKKIKTKRGLLRGVVELLGDEAMVTVLATGERVSSVQ